MEIFDTVKSYIKKDPQKAAAAGFASALGLYLLSKAFTGSSKTQGKIKDVSDGYPYVLSKPVLTDEEVTQRGKIISQVKYFIDIHLHKVKNYEGRAKIEFYLKEEIDGLFVDFYGDAVTKIIINKKDSTQRENYSKRRISLPFQFLNKGLNVIEIYFENSYSNVENGIHSFFDADNSEQYIFSRSGPVYAHKIFPCFDQPDLKAPIKLTVLAPKDWKVYSNEVLKKKSTPTSSYLKQWALQVNPEESGIFEFETTNLLSTYQFSIIAGPFDEINYGEGKSPQMSLVFRKSIRKNIEKFSQHFFDVVSTSLKYLKDSFDLTYQFSKFDIVFYSGIGFPLQETPGVASLSDDIFILDGALNDLEIFSLSVNLVKHVTASWFGGLITNKWWDDIWIQEGISTYLSYFVIDNCEDLKTKLPNSWLYFLFDKEEAYVLDQNLNAHPVCFHIFSTAQCKNQLDAITILKSASAIRYLAKNIGVDLFKNSIKSLIEKYKYSSVDAQVYLDIVQQVLDNAEKYDFDLHVWHENWFKSPGVNQLEALMELEDGQLTCLNVVQTSAVKTSNFLREYKNLKAAFYYSNGAEDLYPMDILADSLTNIEFQKLEKPLAVLLNYDDEDYLKIKLDKASFNYFKKNVSGIKNLTVRALIWRSFSDHARDGKITPVDFIDIVSNEIANETNPWIANFILSNAKHILYNYLPSDYYLDGFQQLFTSILKCLNKEPQTTELIHVYLDYLPSFAENELNALELHKLLDIHEKILRKRHHIKILRALYCKGYLDDGQRQILFDKINDGSILLKQEEKRLKVSGLTDKKEREKIFKKFLKPPADWPLRTSQAIMKGFNHLFNRNKNIDFIDKYFESIPELFDQTSVSYWKSFTTILFPFWFENHEYLIERLKKIQKLYRNKGATFLDVLANLQHQVTKRKIIKFKSLEQQKHGLQKSWVSFKTIPRGDGIIDNIDLTQSQDFTLKLLDANPKSELTNKKSQPELEEQHSFLSSDRASIIEEDEEAKAMLNKSWKKPSPFDKANSIFRERPALTKNLKAMWQADISHFSLQKIIPSAEIKSFYDNLYEKHYLKLFFVFLQKQIESKKWPEVSVDDFNSMCKQAKKVYGPGLTQTNIDTLYVQLSKESPKSSVTQNKDRSLCRFEFIELILRLSIKKYFGVKDITTYVSAVDKFLENDFYPNVKTLAEYMYEGFRYEKIQNEQVDQILKNYEKLLKEIFDKSKSGKDILNLQDVLKFISNFNIDMEPDEVKQCFTLSKIMPIDELAQGTRSYDTMDYAEFLEFIVRVSELTDENPNPTYQKTEEFINKTLVSKE